MILKSEIELAYHLQQSKRKQGTDNVNRSKSETILTTTSFIQVISGIRRCGKSTLLNQLMNKHQKVAYFNFDDPRVFNFEVSDFSKFDEIIPSDTEAYFFDEIQNVPQWEIYIRQLHDYGKKVYVVGSNASLLSKDLDARLAGRYLSTELFPFSYLEFLTFKKQQPSAATFEEYLVMGGFPEFLKADQNEILQNLLKDIVLRDVAIRYGIRNSKSILDIALYLISNIGKETTYNSLKKTFQIGSANTVMDYLSWLEDAYLLFFLQKFSWSAKSVSVSPRKVYAIDNGLIKANSLSYTSDYGRLLENAVFIYLRSNNIKMYYFREKSECDFVLFKNDKCLIPIQVCYEINSDNKDREVNGLLEAMAFFNLSEGYIITLNQKDSLEINSKKIEIIPSYQFFSDIEFLNQFSN